MFKCIIIDDEQHAIDGLIHYIGLIPELILIKSFLDPMQALKQISRDEPVDIIFLDVDMPKITGIELSKEIRSKTNKLVFTTAHTKYAYEAFEANADAYLLKPYTFGKFLITINKFFPKQLPILRQSNEKSSLTKDFFFVKSKEDDLRIVKIKFIDIVAVESRQNYVMIHTQAKNVLTYMSLTEIAKILLTKPGFIQLHRSYIINQEQIETIDGSYVKMLNGTRITVGDNYRKTFNAFVSERLIKAGKRT